MSISVLRLLDEFESQLRERHSEAVLRGLKALASRADDRDALRRLRHMAIELLAQIADLREDRIARVRDDQDAAKTEHEIRDSALSAIRYARTVAEDNNFTETLVASGRATMETYIRRAQENARYRQQGIFISYRRSDTIDTAGRIFDRLRAAFGNGQVFMDVESMPPGINFRVHIVNTISRCCACLILIGNEWLTCVDEKGRRRLDNEADPVRVEIETAMRVRVPTIPLLLGGAHMPRPEELPESISQIHYNHGLPVRPSPDFDNDVARLISNLRLIVQ